MVSEMPWWCILVNFVTDLSFCLSLCISWLLVLSIKIHIYGVPSYYIENGWHGLKFAMRPFSWPPSVLIRFCSCCVVQFWHKFISGTSYFKGFQPLLFKGTVVRTFTWWSITYKHPLGNVRKFHFQQNMHKCILNQIWGRSTGLWKHNWILINWSSKRAWGSSNWS